MQRTAHVKTLAASLLFLLISTAGFSSPPSAPDSCTLLVTLLNEPFENESNVPQVPLTFDAHITMRATVHEVTFGSCPFSSGDRVVFLIHSPSRTFGGYWFHDQRFFVTIEPSNEPETGRQWDLAGIDWPLSTTPPHPEYLICSDRTHVVRVLVGASRTMLGPLTVFRDDTPIVSLGTSEVARARPQRAEQSFTIHFDGDPSGRHLKPAFRFSAHGNAGTLVVDSRDITLNCDWPSGE